MLKTLAPLTFLFLLSFSYAQNNFSYIGRALEGGSQRPLQGVIVSIEALRITDTTDAEGIFRFDRLAKGRQEIRLELKGYRILKQGITIDGRSRYLHNFFLE
ncbi:MAG: carboxypeptidase-like regulatory domain-containing protein, partial [Bacteroidota bacterium]